MLSYIFTENFECNEVRCGILTKNIFFAKGNLFMGHCSKCGKNIDINLINKGIEEQKIVQCDKCKEPCKPKILLKGEDVDKHFYDQINNILKSKLIFIIGSDLLI